MWWRAPAAASIKARRVLRPLPSSAAQGQGATPQQAPRAPPAPSPPPHPPSPPPPTCIARAERVSRVEAETKTVRQVGADLLRLQERVEGERAARETEFGTLRAEVHEVLGSRNLSDEKFQVGAPGGGQGRRGARWRGCVWRVTCCAPAAGRAQAAACAAAPAAGERACRACRRRPRHPLRPPPTCRCPLPVGRRWCWRRLRR